MAKLKTNKMSTSRKESKKGKVENKKPTKKLKPTIYVQLEMLENIFPTYGPLG